MYPQVTVFQLSIIYQQDGARSHWSTDVQARESPRGMRRSGTILRIITSHTWVYAFSLADSIVSTFLSRLFSWLDHSMDARGSLNTTFPNQWIRHDGPICWPPCSPVLTPLDFILWGYVKERVFATPVNYIGELRIRIRDVIATIIGEMLTRTLQNFEYMLDIVRTTNGAHVEVY